MFDSSMYEKNVALKIQIPWDKNTAKGFSIAVVSVLLLIGFMGIFKLEKPKAREIKNTSIPITLLSFGNGDGTGVSKGNLTEEGTTHKGTAPTNVLEDAQVAIKSNVNKVITQNENANPVPVKEVASTEKGISELQSTGSKNVGATDGLTDGTGLGSRGNGKGSGLGFGNIEWGGGGNRVVLHKSLPKFPPGVNTSAEIRIKFTVMPDGTVGKVVPLQKADPRLERAALDALRQWRFNALSNNMVMEGIIPLTFVLR